MTQKTTNSTVKSALRMSFETRRFVQKELGHTRFFQQKKKEDFSHFVDCYRTFPRKVFITAINGLPKFFFIPIIAITKC